MNLYILLGTYNGEKYIQQQIESILKQTVPHFKILIRDDGSMDSSPSLLKQIARSESRVEIITDDKGNLGPAFNFELLMKLAYQRGAEHIAFCDQDDYWIEDKLELYQDIIRSHDCNTPLLIHSDLSVADEALNITHQSFMKFQGIQHTVKAPLRILLVQNFVTGCTTLINRALVEEALPFPPNIVMHDWWLALCAATFGKIEYVATPTTLYRQHALNTIGAKSYIKNIMGLLNLKRIRETKTLRFQNFRASFCQARALLNFIHEKNNVFTNSEHIIDNYVGLFLTDDSTVKSLLKLFKCKVRRQKFLSNIGLYVVAIYSLRHRPLLLDNEKKKTIL